MERGVIESQNISNDRDVCKKGNLQIDGGAKRKKGGQFCQLWMSEAKESTFDGRK